jgi:hypothetical protein
VPSLQLDSRYTRSTQTLAEISGTVLGDLGLRNNNFVTSGDLTRWCNRAQVILARETQCFHVTTTSGTTSGTAEYPIPAESTGKAIAIQRVMYNGKPLCCVSINQLFAHNYYWQTAGPGTPRYYYHQGLSSIGLYPCPDTTDEDILQITTTVIPPEVTEPEDLLYIPHGLDDAIEIYCKLQASLKDAYGEGKERIAVYRQEWNDVLKRAKDLANTIMENEPVRVGEDAWTMGGRNPFWVSPDAVATPLP